MQGQFHHQLFSCRSDFKETRRVSLKSYNSLAFVLRKLSSRHFYYFLLTVYYYDKIASEGEGCKPSSDRQKYIAESEFALSWVSFQKECLMIYFYLDSSGATWMEAEIINV